jgi:hypothetical protein
MGWWTDHSRVVAARVAGWGIGLPLGLAALGLVGWGLVALAGPAGALIAILLLLILWRM